MPLDEITWANYADVGEVLEIGALHDDNLKKEPGFINFAVNVANRILEDLGIKARATWGKWGARLEPSVNPHLSNKQLEDVARAIQSHDSWKALFETTRVFTDGVCVEDWDDTVDTTIKISRLEKELAEAKKKLEEDDWDEPYGPEDAKKGKD